MSIKLNPLTGKFDQDTDKFTQLKDAPSSFSGQIGKFVKVNPSESALIFSTESDPVWSSEKASYSTTSAADLLYAPISVVNYTLPTASASVLGGIKVGSRLSIAAGVLSADVQTTDITGKQDLNTVLTELTALTDPAADRVVIWNDTTNNFEFLSYANWNTAYGWGNHAGLYDTIGAAAAVTPTTLGLVIGTNVLAQRTFGTAANNNTGDFATAAQGALASSALQSLTGAVLLDQSSQQTIINGIPIFSGAGNQYLEVKSTDHGIAGIKLTRADYGSDIYADQLIYNATGSIMFDNVVSNVQTRVCQMSVDVMTYDGAIQSRKYGAVSPQFKGLAAGGTLASPSATVADQYMLFFGASGYVTSFIAAAQGLFGIKAAETFTATAMGTYLTFETVAIGATSRLERMRLTDVGNLGLGTSTFGANSAKVLALANGTAPAAHVDNQIQAYSVDSSDSTATLGLMLEQAVAAVGATVATTKIKVLINGTEYFLLLSTV